MRPILRAVVLAVLLAPVVRAQTAADETGRRLAALEATHADARIAVLEATVADLKRTTREDTLWIRGIIGAGVGLTGVGIAKFRQKRAAPHA